ncbi:MAG TPA: alpha/beta fold hydrolase [Burkholderiales bacterium]|nr:alpha/beta fold hydrolase [Burkholderiales bacterium]
MPTYDRSELVPYRAPRWLPGGHAQTIYAAQFAPRPSVEYRRERWDTPDGDFIDVDWLLNRIEEQGLRIEGTRPTSRLTPHASRPLVVLFHGLEGSSHSHYALSLMHAVRNRGWSGVVVHFRGCSGELNRLPRAYHSGDSAEIDWVLRRLAHGGAPIYAVGVSLGANALLKWLGERGTEAASLVRRAAAISAPFDLTAAGNALDCGFNLVYTRHFLRSMRRKAIAKLAFHRGLYEAAAVARAHTLRAFDDLVTAPLHGYRDTDDYWTRASSKPLLTRIAVPTLLVNAQNDPFLPRAALPLSHEVSPSVSVEFPEEGGHVGFVSGPFPGSLAWLPQRVLGYFWP